MKISIKIIVVFVLIIITGILIITGINLNISSNAQANATAISQAVSQSKSVSSAMAINNTYFIDRQHKNLIWQTDILTSELFVASKVDITKSKNQIILLFGWQECKGFILKSCTIRQEIIDKYNLKPLPWMQRWTVVDDSLVIGYFLVNQ